MLNHQPLPDLPVLVGLASSSSVRLSKKEHHFGAGPIALKEVWKVMSHSCLARNDWRLHLPGCNRRVFWATRLPWISFRYLEPGRCCWATSLVQSKWMVCPFNLKNLTFLSLERSENSSQQVESLTLFLSQILQTRLSMDKTRSLSLCQTMSLIGSSYLWSLTSKGRFERMS